MAERKKFNFGGASLSTRETVESGSSRDESRVQELVSTIENPVINTAFNFKCIPREKLVFNKENDYPMEAIEKLAASILDVGLIHNIDVSYDEDTDTYIIDAGEQRTRAIDLLIEKYKDFQDKESEEYERYRYHVQPFEKGYPCKVSTGTSHMKMVERLSETERKELAEIETEMRLRISNEVGREYNPVRTQESVNRLVELEQQRRNLLGNSERVNIGKKVGEQLNISERQVMKYRAIDRLIPELQDLFKQRGITVADGANYASLNEDEQRQILKLIESGGNKDEIKALYEKQKKLQEQMKQKDEEMKKLEDEKEEALEKVKAAKLDAKEIEEKLRAELQTEAAQQGAADQETIKKLQKRLEQANESVAAYEKQGQELEKKQKEIEKLQEELAHKDKPIVSKETVVVMKAALRVESSIKELENLIVQTNRAVEEYKKIYDGSDSEKTPEEYQEIIMALVEKLSQCSVIR